MSRARPAVLLALWLVLPAPASAQEPDTRAELLQAQREEKAAALEPPGRNRAGSSCSASRTAGCSSGS
jgi:hypothetical protein